MSVKRSGRLVPAYGSSVANRAGGLDPGIGENITPAGLLATGKLADHPDCRAVVDAILAVGRERQLMLVELRSALQSGEKERALDIARQLCGVSLEECHRTDPSIH